MAYGHAERNLAAIRRLEAETEELLSSLPQSGSGQSRWLQQTANANSQHPRRVSAWEPGHLHDHGARDGRDRP